MNTEQPWYYKAIISYIENYELFRVNKCIQYVELWCKQKQTENSVFVLTSVFLNKLFNFLN